MSVTNKWAKISEEMLIQEKYSSGWRGAPAKGVDRLRGARVQIPPSPFSFLRYFFVPFRSWKLLKKLKRCWQRKEKVVWYRTLRRWAASKNKYDNKINQKKILKKVEKSTWQAQNDVLKWLSCCESAADGTLIIEQWQPWKFERISSEKRTLNSKTRMD